MLDQKAETANKQRLSLRNRQHTMLATFSALIFIGELIQRQVFEVLNLGFGAELADIIALIGLTFTGWYAAPFFATAHSVANPGLAYLVFPRDLLALVLAGLAIDRLKSQPWIRDQQWIMFFIPYAPAAATVTAIILDKTTTTKSLDSGLGFLVGLATSFPAAVLATFVYFAIHRRITQPQIKKP